MRGKTQIKMKSQLGGKLPAMLKIPRPSVYQDLWSSGHLARLAWRAQRPIPGCQNCLSSTASAADQQPAFQNFPPSTTFPDLTQEPLQEHRRQTTCLDLPRWASRQRIFDVMPLASISLPTTVTTSLRHCICPFTCRPLGQIWP